MWEGTAGAADCEDIVEEIRHDLLGQRWVEW